MVIGREDLGEADVVAGKRNADGDAHHDRHNRGRGDERPLPAAGRLDAAAGDELPGDTVGRGLQDKLDPLGQAALDRWPHELLVHHEEGNEDQDAEQGGEEHAHAGEEPHLSEGPEKGQQQHEEADRAQQHRHQLPEDILVYPQQPPRARGAPELPRGQVPLALGVEQRVAAEADDDEDAKEGGQARLVDCRQEHEGQQGRHAQQPDAEEGKE
mmetsp:Transcript_60920/g.158052  ORF Transcript_60920/g.158052 Transcript_60920/m.158052 type:complete len:213 (-) Transcript_60920:474-1112(-)